MVWYLWLLLSMFVGSFESIIDKFLVVRDKGMDMLVASFYRNLAFFIVVVIGGLLGIFGEIQIFLRPEIIIAGVIHPITSMTYHYFLKHFEISRYRAVGYVLPFSFLFLDWIFFNISYSFWEIVGVVALVLGSFLIAIDFSSKPKSAFNLKGWLLLVLVLAISAYRMFIFKDFNAAPYFLNEISYYFNIFLVVVPTFLALIFFRRKQSLLKPVALKNHFLAKTFVSKIFDFFAGIFFLKALALQTLTRVSALYAFSPLVFLLFVYVASSVFHVDIEEDFSRKNFIVKVVSITLLGIGGVLLVGIESQLF